MDPFTPPSLPLFSMSFLPVPSSHPFPSLEENQKLNDSIHAVIMLLMNLSMWHWFHYRHCTACRQVTVTAWIQNDNFNEGRSRVCPIRLHTETTVTCRLEIGWGGMGFTTNFNLGCNCWSIPLGTLSEGYLEYISKGQIVVPNRS